MGPNGDIIKIKVSGKFFSKKMKFKYTQDDNHIKTLKNYVKKHDVKMNSVQIIGISIL